MTDSLGQRPWMTAPETVAVFARYGVGCLGCSAAEYDNIEVGAKVVLGPGQSADCDSGTKYPQSTANQVLIVKGPDGKVPVLDCKQTPMKWAN